MSLKLKILTFIDYSNGVTSKTDSDLGNAILSLSKIDNDTTLVELIQALLTYANETTGVADTTLGDAIKTLADGYSGSGGGSATFPTITDATKLSDKLRALIAYGNSITGVNDASLGKVVETLAKGYDIPYLKCNFPESMDGLTISWNVLYKNIEGQSLKSYTRSTVNTTTSPVTVQSTNETNHGWAMESTCEYCNKGDWYLGYIDGYASANNVCGWGGVANAVSSQYILTTERGIRVSIATAARNDERVAIDVSALETAYIYKFIPLNLTHIFGSGNEPDSYTTLCQWLDVADITDLPTLMLTKQSSDLNLIIRNGNLYNA